MIPRWPLAPAELEAAARDRLPRMAYDYIAGGAEDEVTLRANTEAFARYTFRPRVLAGIEKPDTGTRLLGTHLSLPVVIAPVAAQRLAHPRGELATAAAARRAGALFCLSTLASTAIEEVAEAAGPWWFQLYVQRDRGLTRELVDRATAAGCCAVVLAADLAVLGRRERDERNAYHLPPGIEYANLRRSGTESGDAGSRLGRYAAASLETRLGWDDLEQIAGSSRVPVLVKGILRGDDAARAVSSGAAGIVVSNHGGRQLDRTIPSITALADVVDAVHGAVPVLLDSGIRRGTDILIALCRGAAAAMVGRPCIWALALDGEDGVASLLAQLAAEISTEMALLGVSSLDEMGTDLLGRPPDER